MDIEAIAGELSNANLVGVGESTHGTHEFFDLKSKLFKELVINHGFNTLLFEDSVQVCKRINKYINTGDGNLNDLMQDLYSVWRVEELLNLIVWLKENSNDYNLALIGFDIIQTDDNLSRRDELMAKNIQNFLKNNPGSKALVWAHNSHLQVVGSNYNKNPMGLYLKKAFDNNYVAIAQLFGKGSVSATRLKISAPPSSDRTLSVISIDTIPEELAEATLDTIGSQPYFLNKNQIGEIGKQKLKCVRSIGWGLVPEMVNEITEETDVSKSFDGLIYFPTGQHSKSLS